MFEINDFKPNSFDIDEPVYSGFEIRTHWGKITLESAKEVMRQRFNGDGWEFIVEDTKMFARHESYNYDVEIIYTGSVIQNSKQYSLYFKSDVLSFKPREVRLHKELYEMILSKLPWKKEGYWIEDGQPILIKKSGRKLRLRHRRR
jgi:hypothetical protein